MELGLLVVVFSRRCRGQSIILSLTTTIALTVFGGYQKIKPEKSTQTKEEAMKKRLTEENKTERTDNKLEELATEYQSNLQSSSIERERHRVVSMDRSKGTMRKEKTVLAQIRKRWKSDKMFNEVVLFD